MQKPVDVLVISCALLVLYNTCNKYSLADEAALFYFLKNC